MANDFDGLADMLALRAVKREFFNRLMNGLSMTADYRAVYQREYERVISAYGPAGDVETRRTETPDA